MEPPPVPPQERERVEDSIYVNGSGCVGGLLEYDLDENS